MEGIRYFRNAGGDDDDDDGMIVNLIHACKRRDLLLSFA